MPWTIMRGWPCWRVRSSARIRRDQHGRGDGAIVFIHSRRGTLRVQGRISERVPPGTVFLSFHSKASPATLLTYDHTLDPVAKIPDKVCAGRLEMPPGPPKRWSSNEL
jgi:predicted molibdopterin-dependent oxidoreductase YjgC